MNRHATETARVHRIWLEAEGRQLRGCQLCEHATDATGGTCKALEVTGGRPPMPTDLARSTRGPCGPEALFMAIRERNSTQAVLFQ